MHAWDSLNLRVASSCSFAEILEFSCTFCFGFFHDSILRLHHKVKCFDFKMTKKIQFGFGAAAQV